MSTYRIRSTAEDTKQSRLSRVALLRLISQSQSVSHVLSTHAGLSPPLTLQPLSTYTIRQYAHPPSLNVHGVMNALSDVWYVYTYVPLHIYTYMHVVLPDALPNALSDGEVSLSPPAQHSHHVCTYVHIRIPDGASGLSLVPSAGALPPRM